MCTVQSIFVVCGFKKQAMEHTYFESFIIIHTLQIEEGVLNKLWKMLGWGEGGLPLVFSAQA